MLVIDATLETPEQNLALDEALYLELEAAPSQELGRPAEESLRFWESSTTFVVLGVAGKLHADVQVERCRQDGIPVLRRASGGGTVLQGPGCLNYALVLSLEARPELRDLTRCYREILGRTAAALGSDVRQDGTSDMTFGGRKLSGSAQKRGRRAILHHGTILYSFDLERVSSYLREPASQPPYRASRAHEDFIENYPLSREEIERRLCAAWGVLGPRRRALPELTRLVHEKYATREWTERF